MGKTRLGLLLLFVVTIAGACVAGRPTSEQLAVADCGPYPENWQEIVQGYLSQVLYDPYSAAYQFEGSPQRGWVMVQRSEGPPGELLAGYEPVYGWEVRGRVDVRNRFGGYVGSRLFIVLIRDGRVVTGTLGGR